MLSPRELRAARRKGEITYVAFKSSPYYPSRDVMDYIDRKYRRCAHRWEYQGYYIEQPHPDRGGVWYTCAYDRGTRNVRRSSLRTPDLETAKARLIALVEATPARAEDAAHPRDVAAVHVLTAYLDCHARQIASVEFAERTGELVAGYLLSVKQPLMSVAAWTPARPARIREVADQ